MKNYKNIFTVFVSLLLLSLTGITLYLIFDTSKEQKEIQKPLFMESHVKIIKKDSIIQVPITIHSDEIKKAIYRDLKTPIASGIIQKKLLDVKYRVHLQNLNISFVGSKIKIFTSYLVDFTVNYKNSIKKILKGKVYVDLDFTGVLSINSDATFMLKVSKEEVDITFTKVAIPTILEKLDFLKITKAEVYLVEKLLEKSIKKQVLKKIQKQISKKQVNINLHNKIQKYIFKNSVPTLISKDLWLLPRAIKVSLSQAKTKNNLPSDEIYINVGVTAQPELVTNITKPAYSPTQAIPILVESFEPKVYLYPSIHLKYNYIESKIKKELNTFLSKNYENFNYFVHGITLYPSAEKLVVSIDLQEIDNPKKIFTFYLWGTPKLDKDLQTISLSDFDYTLESRNVLLQTAQWILDEKIKNLIHEKTIFNYTEKLSKLAKKISIIKKKTQSGTLTGSIKNLTIENISTSKDSFIIYVTAKGAMSYAVSLSE